MRKHALTTLRYHDGGRGQGSLDCLACHNCQLRHAAREMTVQSWIRRRTDSARSDVSLLASRLASHDDVEHLGSALEVIGGLGLPDGNEGIHALALLAYSAIVCLVT